MFYLHYLRAITDIFTHIIYLYFPLIVPVKIYIFPVLDINKRSPIPFYWT